MPPLELGSLMWPQGQHTPSQGNIQRVEARPRSVSPSMAMNELILQHMNDNPGEFNRFISDNPSVRNILGRPNSNILNGQPALHYAIEHGHIGPAIILLRFAPLLEADAMGRTPLQLAMERYIATGDITWRNFVTQLIEKNRLDVEDGKIDSYIAARESIDPVSGKIMFNPLEEAVSDGNEELAEELIRNRASASNYTRLLYLAIENKLYRIIDIIAREHPESLTEEYNGYTVLEHALINNDARTVRILLDAKASPFLVISRGRPPPSSLTTNPQLRRQLLFLEANRK
jgi:ankyrin repeat protein